MRKNANSFRDKGVKGDPALLQSIQRRTPSAAGDCETHHVPGATIVTPRRDRRRGRGGASICPFGKLVNNAGAGEDKKGINGGVLIAGDKIWNVAAQAINLASSGDFLAWLEVGVTCNSEDGLPLPNLLTSTEPTWQNGSLAGGYPDMTQPDGATPAGTAIVPIGAFSVTGGAVTFTPVACGSITLGYCPTNISITRG